MFGKTEWSTLSKSEKQLVILQFICEKTMGAPNYLVDLRAELNLRRSRLSVGRCLSVRELTNDEFVSAVYELHFSKEFCAKLRKDKLLELEAPVLGKLHQGLQHDYVR